MTVSEKVDARVFSVGCGPSSSTRSMPSPVTIEAGACAPCSLNYFPLTKLGSVVAVQWVSRLASAAWRPVRGRMTPSFGSSCWEGSCWMPATPRNGSHQYHDRWLCKPAVTPENGVQQGED